MSDSRIGARTAIGPVLEAAIAALLDEQKAEHNLVKRVGQICDSAGASEPDAADRREWARWEGEGGAVVADQLDQLDEVIVEPGDWQTKLDEVVDSLRRHGFDGAADEIVRHLPPQPKLEAEERACEKHNRELAFSRKEGADRRKSRAWLLEYLGAIRDELAAEGGAAGIEEPSPAHEPTEADKHPLQPLAPLPVPEEQLTSWREILVALGRGNNNEDKQAVGRLNEKFNGPIVKRGQGTQPFANKRKLLEWWNDLEEMVQAQADRDLDKRETVKGTHGYGREGEVVPGISGEVKKRRKDRQP